MNNSVENEAAGFAAFVISNVTLSVLVGKGIITRSEARDSLDRCMLLLEQGQFLNADARKIAHSLIESTMAAYATDEPPSPAS